MKLLQGQMLTRNVRSPAPGLVCASTSGPSPSSSSALRQKPHFAPRLRPTEDVPAQPSFSPAPAPLWLPGTSAAGQAQTPVWQQRPFNHQADPLLAAPPAMRVSGGISSFRVQLNEPPTPPGKQKHPDYYANVGDAIRTLRDDIPQLFAKDLNYGIYREDIVFRDPVLLFKGIKNYQLIFWSLRFHGRLFFSRLYVDVLRIWQPEDNQIKMRWRIHGVPRVWWEAEGGIDGISTYKLDSDGMIYEHSISQVQLRDPPITNPLLYGLNYILAPRMVGGQMPCPLPFSAEFSEWSAGGEAGGEELTMIKELLPATTSGSIDQGW